MGNCTSGIKKKRKGNSAPDGKSSTDNKTTTQPEDQVEPELQLTMIVTMLRFMSQQPFNLKLCLSAHLKTNVQTIMCSWGKVKREVDSGYCKMQDS
ncbi:uncharacterized protein LOC144525348 isoform X1 [Sander vitreus]